MDLASWSTILTAHLTCIGVSALVVVGAFGAVPVNEISEFVPAFFLLLLW
jgi:hypothetical protein